MKTWKHEEDECFERGLDFNKQIRKNIKTDTPGSMKKTNVSSEVLILPNKVEKCAPRRAPFWAPKRAPK